MTDTDMAVGDHRDLLDIIDSLRSQGVSHYVDLPEIIVCGDQSAGKSSVLEAISGMPFPTRDGVCTRFATELVLRRGREAQTKVSITPGENRYGEDKERLESWQPKASIDKEGLETVTNEAKDAMRDLSGTGEFYEDILRIELTGPGQPHLTMVDLPGLFRSGNKKQSDDDVDIVRAMVERYMARPRSIILTVVSAKYEYVLQEVTRMAKSADPEGLRTMGLITKPDTLDVGSDSERYFVRLAQNLEAELRLGWHVLKNRNFEERGVASAQRDKIEAKFFAQGLWTSIDASQCGVAALRVRLSAVLRDQILTQLPSLVQDVENGIHDCATRLDRLGPVRGTSQQQMSYLLRVSEGYTSLVTQAVEGTYTDPFFGNRKKIDNYHTRLRAVVQNRLGEFAEQMRLDGQSQYIVDSESEIESGREIRDQIPRSDYLKEVSKRFKYSKGRELPGLWNPLIVGDLFIEHCKPWEGIAMRLVEDILEAAHLATQMIVNHITANDVAEGVARLVRQEIEGLKDKLDAQVNALLASAARHAITYNPQLNKNVELTHQDRDKRDHKKVLRKIFGPHQERQTTLNPIELVNMLEEAADRNKDRYGSGLAVDYMEAYYKVAVNRFIDDVGVLAIEDCLISKLPTLFRSSNVLDMSDGDRASLAGETPECSLERKRLEAKRATLETGLQGLKSLHKRRNVVNPPKQDQGPSEDLDDIPAATLSSSERASTATMSSSAEVAPRAVAPDASPSPYGVPVPMPVDIWSPQAESYDGYVDDWGTLLSKPNKKKLFGVDRG